jgi:antitoxin component YwqK of YwqJK toxin-antitoxin module
MYNFGKKNGIEITYYDTTGGLKSSANFINDVQTGTYTTFYRNGLSHLVANYENGLLSGKVITYYMYNAVELVENYSKGKLDGWVREYFQNGNLKREEMYKSGILETRKEFNITGDLISTSGY